MIYGLVEAAADKHIMSCNVLVQRRGRRVRARKLLAQHALSTACACRWVAKASTVVRVTKPACMLRNRKFEQVLLRQELCSDLRIALAFALSQQGLVKVEQALHISSIEVTRAVISKQIPEAYWPLGVSQTPTGAVCDNLQAARSHQP